MISDIRPAEGLNVIVRVIHGELCVMATSAPPNKEAVLYTPEVLRMAADWIGEQRRCRKLPVLFPQP